jgi:hypothetical protein
MPALPEQPRTAQAGQPGTPLSDAVIEAAVDRSIEEANRYGTTPKVVVGNTPHVAQPDTRIVPAWATGIAVASIGVGAGATGIGCAAWLLFQGLSAVSVPSLERFAWIVIAPFAGIAMAATAIGTAFSRAKKSSRDVHQHFHGDVVQDQSTHESKAYGIFAKNDNKERNR